MSRTVGLVLLGGAALSTCCCLLQPSRPPAPTQYDENGNPITPTEGATTSTGGYAHRHSGLFWLPWYWGRSSYTPGYRPGYTSRPGPTASPGATTRPSGGASPGGTVTRGGFGGTGHSIGGAAA